ncbi:zwei Ig domain protein zig-8-like isoform X2 [Crassostrea virginica]
MAKCFFVFKKELIHVLFLTVLVSVGAYNYKRQVRPSFLDTGRRNITVPRGGLAELRCRIRNLGPKEVAWRKLSMDYPLTVGTFVFEKDDHISVDHQNFPGDEAEWNLIIKRAQPRHSGTYECQISATTVHTYHVHLHVLDLPSESEQGIAVGGTKYVNLYDPITLTCNVTFGRNAQAHLDWFHNGELIKASDAHWVRRLRISDLPTDGRMSVSQLHISYSLQRDAGRYVCRTINYANDEPENGSVDVIVLNTNKDISKRTGDKIDTQEGGQAERAGQSGSNRAGHVTVSLLVDFLLVLVVVLR